jgi:excisionase family DNA binding protein
MSDYNITLFEACEILNRSKKTIGRYIRQGRLNPQKVKSQQGTLEYRFSKADLEAFKEKQARQETQDKPDETGQDGQTEQEQIKKRQDRTRQTRQTRQTGQSKKVIYQRIKVTKSRRDRTRQDRTGR